MPTHRIDVIVGRHVHKVAAQCVDKREQVDVVLWQTGRQQRAVRVSWADDHYDHHHCELPTIRHIIIISTPYFTRFTGSTPEIVTLAQIYHVCILSISKNIAKRNVFWLQNKPMNQKWTETAETTVTKLAVGILRLTIHLMLAQKVKGQGHRVKKCKNIFQLKAIEWSAWVCTLSSGI